MPASHIVRFRPAPWLLLGGAAAGAAWACFEVLWLVCQPHMPFAMLRVMAFVPPRSLSGITLVALATYVPIGATIGLVGGLVSGRRWPIPDATSAVVRGSGWAGAALLALGVLVWLNLLSQALPLRPGMLASDAVALLLCVLVAVGLTRAVGRLVTSSAAGLLLIGAALPGAMLVGAWAAHRAIEFPEIAVRGEARAGMPNVVFITIDTLRADHVGSYAPQSRIKTPFLDQLASEGVRFENAISQVPHTTPSHISMFSSLYPFAHGARNGVPLRPGLKTLPEELRKLGYHTAAFPSAYTVVSQVTGLEYAFDLYVDSLSAWIPFLGDASVEPLALYRLVARSTGNGVAAPYINDRIRSWMADGPETPFFLWFHYFDAHGPFDPVPEYRDLYLEPGMSDVEEMLALYDAEITYTDAQLGELFSDMRASGLLDDAIVVLTSDHGQMWGEPTPNPEMGHGRTLYDPVLRVPLIFWGPDRIKPGRVVLEQVESIDLAPTILELIGAKVPGSFAGRSVAAAVLGEGSPPEPRFAFSQTASHTADQWFTVRSADWKLHVNTEGGQEQLFDLRRDPGERRNVIAEEPEVAERLRRVLAERMEISDPERHELDATTRARLEAMGYLVE